MLVSLFVFGSRKMGIEGVDGVFLMFRSWVVNKFGDFIEFYCDCFKK